MGSLSRGGAGLQSIVRSARNNLQITTLAVADRGTLIDYTSGTFVQTISAAATLTSGWYCWLQNSGAGVITLTPQVGQLIDGLASYAMQPGEMRVIQCDGVGFHTVIAVEAGGGGSVEFLETVTAAGAATALIGTGLIDGTYDRYILEAIDVGSSVNNDTLEVHMKLSGAYPGAGYTSTLLNGANPPIFKTVSAAQGHVSENLGAGGSASQRAQFTAEIFAPAGSAAKVMTFQGGGYSGFSGYPTNPIDSTVVNTDTGALTEIKFEMATGNITGTFNLYGVRPSA